MDAKASGDGLGLVSGLRFAAFAFSAGGLEDPVFLLERDGRRGGAVPGRPTGAWFCVRLRVCVCVHMCVCAFAFMALPYLQKSNSDGGTHSQGRIRQRVIVNGS